MVRPAGVSVSTCAHDAIWINATPHPLHNHCKHIIYYFEQEALIYITIIVLNQAFSYLLFPLFCLLLLLDLLYTPSGSNAILYRARHILLSTYAHCSQICECIHFIECGSNEERQYRYHYRSMRHGKS